MPRPLIFSPADDEALRASYRERGAAWCAKRLGFTVDQIYGRAGRLGLMGGHTSPRQGKGRASPNAAPLYDHRALAAALGIKSPQPPFDKGGQAKREGDSWPPEPGAVLERHYMGK